MRILNKQDNNKELYIYHHLGLGDHIICAGIVREYAKRYDYVYLFVKQHNKLTVNSIYYYDNNIVTVPLPSDTADARAVEIINHGNKQTLVVGFGDLNTVEPFDQQFYKLAGVDFSKRWSKFNYYRNEISELALLDKLLPKERPVAPFALRHHDVMRGYIIHEEKFTPGLPVVDLPHLPGYSMTDYLALAACASEIHVIDSSFMFLLDSVSICEKEPPLYIHRYSRQNVDWNLPTLKKNWTILQ